MADNRLSYYLILMPLFFVMMSCTPSVPSKYIQPDEMEDILYDYHMANAMSGLNGSKATSIVTYNEAVLKKNGITQAEFDSSMVYYTRHTRLLQKIYESLSDRLRNEALALGASAGEINKFSINSANGDTTNIWIGERTIVLTPHKSFNISSFVIKADSTFKPGDKLWLNFNTQFIYQEGTRDAIALLAVKFNNDSVSTQNLYISTPNHYTLQLGDSRHVGIKEVKGYFILNNGNPADVYSTTFKLMILSNISLIKIHSQKAMEKPQADSVQSIDHKRSNDSSLSARPPRHLTSQQLSRKISTSSLSQ